MYLASVMEVGLRVNKVDKTALGVLGVVVAAAGVNYVICRLRNGRFVQPGEPDSCISPAIREGIKAGLFKLLRVPLSMQPGIDYVLRSPDLYDVYARSYHLQVPAEFFGD